MKLDVILSSVQGSIMDSETNLEKISGSLTTAATATIVSAVVGTPLAALLPVLVNTLASKRHKERVEGALADIQSDLDSLGSRLSEVSDAQFKLINEAVITILHSPDDAKIEQLKTVIRNSSIQERLTMHQAILISRTLRDASVEELGFMLECQGSDIVFHENKVDGCINVEKITSDGEKATGLVSLGLLTKEQGDGVWDDHGKYVFTPLAKELIQLLSR